MGFGLNDSQKVHFLFSRLAFRIHLCFAPRVQFVIKRYSIHPTVGRKLTIVARTLRTPVLHNDHRLELEPLQKGWLEMAEELQGLLDRIRKEGLEKAEEEAKAIIDAANQTAAEIKKTAEANAAKKVETAQEEAEKLEQRSISAIQHAARDIVLSVGDAVQQAFETLTQKDISEILDGESFAKLVHDVVKAYVKEDDKGGIEVLLSPKQQEQVSTYLNQAMNKDLRKGITIKSTRGVISGFSVVLRDQGIEHDFRGETLTSAFLELLRPQLGEIVKKAMETTEKKS